jgi:methionyl-tRNA formyltransferase
MTINILIDNKNSWITSYARRLVHELKKDHKVNLVHNQKNLIPGDLAFFLSCEEIVASENMKKNRHNLVIHESPLPCGKGMSPLTWQILEGKNVIPIVLFEASQEVDNGRIYLQEAMHFEGHELIDELRDKQARETIRMIKKIISLNTKLVGEKQSGKESFYPRRRPQDSELDINKTIVEQFNLLRVVDNERYPAFFRHRGHKYVIKIYKEK